MLDISTPEGQVFGEALVFRERERQDIIAKKRIDFAAKVNQAEQDGKTSAEIHEMTRDFNHQIKQISILD